MNPLYVGPSENQAAWEVALDGGKDNLLKQLVEKELPGVVYFEIATFINRLYRQLHGLRPVVGVMGEHKAHDAVERVLPTIQAIRRKWGWQARELDIGLLRWIRRASALSVVIGAGATMAAGGPSWSKLVQQLLTIAVEKGREIRKPKREVAETSHGRSLHVRFKVVGYKRLKLDEEKRARRVLTLIEKQQASTEDLMIGAQLSYDLFGQHLFTELTRGIYDQVKQPSSIHRAIAELAHGQRVPDRGPGIFPGWEAIITYNFDNLMGEALAEQQVPYVVWSMANGQPAIVAEKKIQGNLWYQPVFHLHGYTPRPTRLFEITDIDFVFSTAQYLKIYGNKRSGIISDILDNFLANPVHIALYVGCSFQDEAMNDLLKEAAERCPGRHHYVLLRLPDQLIGKEVSSDLLEQISKPHHQRGVRPIWVHEYNEISEIIRRLK